MIKMCSVVVHDLISPRARRLACQLLLSPRPMYRSTEFQLLNSFKKFYLRNDWFKVKNRCEIFFPLFLPDIRDYWGASDKKLEKGHISFLKRVGNRTVKQIQLVP